MNQETFVYLSRGKINNNFIYMKFCPPGLSKIRNKIIKYKTSFILTISRNIFRASEHYIFVSCLETLFHLFLNISNFLRRTLLNQYKLQFNVEVLISLIVKCWVFLFNNISSQTGLHWLCIRSWKCKPVIIYSWACSV